MDKVAQALRARRKAECLTQRAVAHRVGCSQPYLSQVERGRRPLSEKMAVRLEEFLESPGLFTTAPFLKGRPPLTAESKEVRRTVARGAVAPESLPPELGRKPRHPQLHQKWGVEDRLSGLGPVLGTDAGELLEKLEQLKGPDQQRYWRNFNSLRFDSWCERWFLVALALLGAQLTGVNLARYGCSLAVVNGRTGKPFKGCHRGFLFQYKGVSIIWAPQVAVRTEAMYRCPDNVLLVSKGDKTVTAVVEVIGPDHTLEETVERAFELGVPFFATEPCWVGDDWAITGILEWAADLVA